MIDVALARDVAFPSSLTQEMRCESISDVLVIRSYGVGSRRTLVALRAGPARAWHNVRNTGSEALKLYTLYAPPEHADGTVHRTKAEASTAEHFTGKTTE